MSAQDQTGEEFRDHAHPHLHKLKVKLIHTSHGIGKLKNIVNRNHRHDEPHEQVIDQRREAIAKSHRYDSFAPVTEGNEVKWYVDGRDYFWAVSEALENAKETIYICDWWLSPELFLRRPPAYSKNWRLDRVLKRKAEAGVKIYIIVYKEVSQALTCNSQHTKMALEEMFDHHSPGRHNLVVMRHPDHYPFLHGADATLYWAHHEKLVVIDHKLAFVGGLDLCFGRWDTHQHPLADVHPGGISSEVWPGQDFNNNRVMDFHQVEDWKQNQLDKRKFGRMPWHDVHLGIVGPAAMDVAEHFVGRWNFIKRDKYKRRRRFPWLRLEGQDEEVLGVQHPRFPVGGYITHPLDGTTKESLQNQGPCEVQILRSAADWSHGLDPKEHSIQNAYKDLIEKAQRFVYIENQFFITATGDQQYPVQNTIGASIVKAIERAHKENRKFRVIILIPAIPGFPGDLREDSATGTRAIIDYQYKSICRGEHSIYGQLRKKGIEAEKYIFVFNLRIYDRLHVTDRLLQHEKETGVGYQEMQQQQAIDVMGPNGATQYASSSSSSSISAASNVDEAGLADRRERFEHDLEDAPAQDSIAHCAMAGNKPVSEEMWDDGDRREVENLIQEELYVHAKVLIIDDEVMVVGSSNINDRSQLGDHDSEVSAVVRHCETVKSLRMQLWMEHLGLLHSQKVEGDDDTEEQKENRMPPVGERAEGEKVNYLMGDEEARSLVDDPLSEDVWNMWTQQATTNTEIYRHLFRVDPDDNIITWKDYDEFCPKRENFPAGHIWDADKHSPEAVKKELSKIRGHLVWMPLKFLEKEEMAEPGLQVNRITQSIYT